MVDEFERVQSALHAVSPDVDRMTWVRLAMSCKAALGDAGFEVWDSWSSGGSTYDPKVAKTTWRSVKAGGGVGPGTLFAVAKQHGWQGQPIEYDHEEEARRRAARAVEERIEAERKAKRRAEVAKLAQSLISRAKIGEHAYFSSKGFRGETGFTLNVTPSDWRAMGFRELPPPKHPLVLVIPMRDVETNAIVNAQLIDTAGNKTFLSGGQMRGTVYRLGRGTERWLVEGYATGLSVRAALQALFRTGEVVVCWNAGNLPAVAEKLGGKRYVIADNDPELKNGAEGAGTAYAKKTGLPWWTPPEVGTDANDYHLSAGLRALCEAMRGMLAK